MNAAGWTLRRGAARGRLHNDWLDARFSFSFADWRAPHGERFGVLRALNEDVVQPGRGFAMHPHRDLEILILPLEGQVEHRDSQGRHALVRPGEVQLMRAGHGIAHSQMNPQAGQVDRHLQIWVEPRRHGLAPGVWQQALRAPAPGAWQVFASPDGRDGSLVVEQDLCIALGLAGEGQRLAWQGRPGRSQYLHLVDGQAEVQVGEAPPLVLAPGDALAFDAPAPACTATGLPQARWLLFDLPSVSPAPGAA